MAGGDDSATEPAEAAPAAMSSLAAPNGPVPPAAQPAALAEHVAPLEAAAPGGQKAGPAVGIGTGPRTTEDLAEVMRRRRQSCVEFESAPSTSTGAEKPAPAEPAEVPTAAATDLAAQAAPVAARTASDLAEVMRQRRSACTEFESAPGTSTADACTVNEATGSVRSAKADLMAAADRSAREPARTGTARGARVCTSDRDLHSWLERMKGRCEVLESTPAATTADAWCEDTAATSASSGTEALATPDPEGEAVIAAAVLEPEAVEAPAAAEAVPGPAEDAPPSVDSGGPQPAAAEAAAPAALEAGEEPGAEALHADPHHGEAMPHALRMQVWSQRLHPAASSGAVPAPAGKTPLSSSAIGGTMAAVRRLLAASAAADDPGGSGGASASAEGAPPEPVGASALAEAFAERHFHWLGKADACCSAGAEGGPAFALLALLLRYHCPSLAGGADLAAALTAACDGPAGLVRLLLSPVNPGDEMVLLLLCDLLILEDLEALALFVIVALAMEAQQEGAKFEQVRLRGLGARGAAGVRRCVDRARELHEATPRSFALVLSRGVGSASRSRLQLSVCVVAPDEVIHHVYERPSGSWRFVVVDVRREAERSLALPVGLRVNPAQDRRAVLRDMPHEDSIHLCILGDEPPAPGDEALELGRFLTLAAGGRRPHVSVVEGGWPAVAGLVRSFGLEFMRSGGKEHVASATTATDGLKEKAKGLQQAVAAVAGVAEQVTSGATAAAMRHKVAKQAQQVRSRATRALQGLGTAGGLRGGGAPAETPLAAERPEEPASPAASAGPHP